MQFYKPKSILATLSPQHKASWNETFLRSCQEHLTLVLRMNEIVLMQSSNTSYTGYSMGFVIGETKESLIVATCQHNIENKSSLTLTTRNTQSRLKSILNGHFFADQLELKVQDIFPSKIPAEDLAFLLTNKPRGWKMQGFVPINTKDNHHKATLAFGLKNVDGEMSLRSWSVSNVEIYGWEYYTERSRSFTRSLMPVEDLAPYICADFHPLPSENSIEGMSGSPVFAQHTLYGMITGGVKEHSPVYWFDRKAFQRNASVLPARLIQQRMRQLFKSHTLVS